MNDVANVRGQNQRKGLDLSALKERLEEVPSFVPGYGVLDRLVAKDVEAQGIVLRLIDRSISFLKFMQEAAIGLWYGAKDPDICRCKGASSPYCKECRRFRSSIQAMLNELRRRFNCPRLRGAFSVDQFATKLAAGFLQTV